MNYFKYPVSIFFLSASFVGVTCANANDIDTSSSAAMESTSVDSAGAQVVATKDSDYAESVAQNDSVATKDSDYAESVAQNDSLDSTEKVVSADVSTDPADEVASFDSDFLVGMDKNVDLSRFEHGNPVNSGEYQLDVFVNKTLVGREKIAIKSNEQGVPSSYCFTPAQIKEIGIDVNKTSVVKALGRNSKGEKIDFLAGKSCIDPTKLDESISANVDLSDLSLNMVVPQAFMGHQVQGYIDPSEFQNGINAGFVTYNAYAYHNDPDHSDSNTRYSLGINSGINIEGWRFRHNGTYLDNSDVDGGDKTYQSISTYVQHDVTPLSAEFTLGEYFTPSDVFDSVPFKGVQLASDDQMLPESERGYAPEIRGFADSNAQVTVRQGTNVVYQTSVAPGPFVINDLYDTGYSGDLDVTVTEADGRERRFIVPFSSVAQLLRPDTYRFSVTGAKYRDDSDDLSHEPEFIQTTYRRGLTSKFTGYGGTIFAENYNAFNAGIAMGTGIGAFAADVTFSHARHLPDNLDDVSPAMKGRSYRLTYSKLLDYTKTNISVAAYKFSSEDYLDFEDAIELKYDDDPNLDRERNKFQLSISQPIGELGSLYVSGIAQNYWNRNNSDVTYQVGYSQGYKWGSVSISASRTLDEDSDYDTEYVASVSIPFGEEHPFMVTETVNYDDSHNNSYQTTVSGNAGERDQLSYSAYETSRLSDDDRNNSYGFDTQYDTTATNVGLAYSHGEDFKQYTASLRGTAIAHSGGVTFTSGESDTMAIVQADGAEGAYIGAANNARIGSSGYAAITGLTPYRNNDVTIDPKGMSKNVELSETSQKVVPRQGAIVLVKYDSVTGYPLLLRMTGPDGKEVPFGADVQNAKGKSVATVGQSGMAFLRTEKETGNFRVIWGQGNDQSCSVSYKIPNAGDKIQTGYRTVDETCK